MGIQAETRKTCRCGDGDGDDGDGGGDDGGDDEVMKI